MTGALAISRGTIAAIVVVAVIDLFAVLLLVSFLRARREARAVAAAEEGIELPGRQAPRAPRAVSRRDFFRRSLVVSLSVFGAQFGAATIAFLWPNLRGGFGSLINAGRLEDIRNEINQTGQPFYFGSGRFYLITYDGAAADEATGVDYEADGVIAEGLMPLYQRCVHLGCRVPFCAQSKWFECPCHGSKYNGAGEWQLGPAPTGMDRFRITVEGGDVMVDTSEIVPGPPQGTNTIGQPPQGPFCV